MRRGRRNRRLAPAGEGRLASLGRSARGGDGRRTGCGASAAAQEPPAPPILLTPLVACDPDTDPQVLWHIARHAPELRRWLPANPAADAALLEYVAQAGGPGVREALTVLLDSVGS